jgi:transcriptional regulator GlxA family with amidase domain
LEQRFQRALGIAPAAEIRRVRMESAKHLLISTDLSMPDVAAAAGFARVEVMNRLFRALLKQAPSHFRRLSRRLPMPSDEPSRRT